MRGLATLILAAAMVIGSFACASAAGYPYNPHPIPPGGVGDIVEPVSYGGLGTFAGPIGPLPNDELGPFIGPIGPQCDILLGASHNDGVNIASNVGFPYGFPYLGGIENHPWFEAVAG